MARAVRTLFDRIAPSYDRLNRVLSFGLDLRWRRRAVRALGALDGAPVLDLCAGTGDFGAEVRRRFPFACVVGADFAREMLAAGGAKRAGEPVQADALRLPFGDGVFAAAVCGFGVRNLDDPRKGLAEVARVLRPGGRFAVLEFFRPETRAQRALHAFYNRRVVPAMGRALSGDADAYAYLPASIERFMTRAGYEAAAREAGFEVENKEDLFPGVASLVVLRR
jgi:ubiquinone/menaquinone biosynthesis methyltransferase